MSNATLNVMKKIDKPLHSRSGFFLPKQNQYPTFPIRDFSLYLRHISTQKINSIKSYPIEDKSIPPFIFRLVLNGCTDPEF